MNPSLRFCCIAALLGWLMACEPPFEQLTYDPDIRLRFSADTLYFDTIFTQIRTQTLRLKVYNPDPNAIHLSDIRIGGGEDSPFSMIANGIPGQALSGLTLLGNDSLLILIRAEIAEEQEDVFLVEDQISFVSNGNIQQVALRANARDAFFYRDDILCDQVWRSDKPHVIVEDVLVDSLCELTIEAGTQIYLAGSSDFFVQGSLRVLGTADAPVVFQQIRQETRYLNAPGQWDGITFLVGSHNNLIRHAIIRNANTGIYLGTPDSDTLPDLILRQTRIENMAQVGVQCFSADLLMENCLINNCIDHTFSALIGGNYALYHNTLGNFSFNFSRELPQAVFANYLPQSDPYLAEDLSLTLVNNIIWGNLEEELVFLEDENLGFNLIASHNLLKTTLTTTFSTNGHILNEHPLFVAPSLYDYGIDSLSPAVNAGLPIGVAQDLKGEARIAAPDIGALEFRPR